MPEPARALAVLYVDDEPHNLELFRLQFADAFDVRTAARGEEALVLMEQADVGVLLTDERMPGMSGVELLARVVERWPDTVRVIVSAYSDAQRLLLAINRGHAHEYVVKPWEKADLQACIERGLTMAQRRRELAARADLAEVLAETARQRYGLAPVAAGEGGGLHQVMELVRRAAPADATVLVTGETGTGKELIAHAIHEASPRRAAAFVTINCAALPEGLLESELFGHERGAFTGATGLRRGKFELAHGGTLFLDEIGDISPKLQVSLLRVLQEKRITRLGGAAALAVDARVVAATHRDLLRCVREGTFREDLYYRLNVVPIHVPPLRERPQDVEPLARHFIAKHSRSAGPGPGHRLAPGVIDRLRRYSWPGNVRELENLVQRALILADGPELTDDDFTFQLQVPEPTVREQAQEAEQQELRKVLLEHGGNYARAARALGIPRTTLVSRAKKHGLLP